MSAVLDTTDIVNKAYTGDRKKVVEDEKMDTTKLVSEILGRNDITKEHM